MSNNKPNALRAVLTVIFAMLIMSVPSLAFANGAGEGTKRPSKGTMTKFKWKVVTSDSKGSAYDKFVGNHGRKSLSGFRPKTTRGMMNAIPRQYTDSGDSLIRTCQQSKTIWWVQGNAKYGGSNQYGWAHNLQNMKTYPSIGGSKGQDFAEAEVIGGPAPDAKVVQKMIKWLSFDAKLSRDKYVLVCDKMADTKCKADDPKCCTGPECVTTTTTTTTTTTKTPCPPGECEDDEPDIPELPPRNVVECRSEDADIRGEKDVEEFHPNEPYSWTTAVDPQVLVGGVDPIGQPNLHSQIGVPQKSHYGKLVDEVRSGKHANTPVATMISLVEQALEKDKKQQHSKIDLDESNKAGMAEGGVLNFKEHTLKYQIDSKQERCVWYRREYVPVNTYGTDSEGNTIITSTTYVPSGNWILVREDPWQYDNRAAPGTLELTGFWQMLSVHCNAEEFNALIAATPGAEVENTGDPTKRLAAVAYTKTYTKDDLPNGLTFPKDFGDTSNGNKARKRSGELGFYDKECPFECSADPAGTGASEENQAVDNARDNTVADGPVDKYGATAGEQNRNRFEFFRDNTPHDINLDVWYPKTGGVVKYDGHEPLTTTVTRWALGTPGVNSTSGGQFTMKSADGEKVFGAPGTAPNQRNWAPGPSAADVSFSNETSASLKGLHNTFFVQATWASEKDRPQVLNVKWEYAPMVGTVIAGKAGFDHESQRIIDRRDTVNAPIQGKCYAGYGQDTVDTYPTKVQKATGSETDNTIDGKLIDGESTPPADNATDLIINFVRSTSE